jgi:hypothetical protein
MGMGTWFRNNSIAFNEILVRHFASLVIPYANQVLEMMQIAVADGW